MHLWFEHVLGSGGMLPCLMPVYLYMFDRWYPDMIWHVWCPVGSNTSDRRSADTFWQVWFPKTLQVVHCHVYVLFVQTLLPGGILSSRQGTTRSCKNPEKKDGGLACFEIALPIFLLPVHGIKLDDNSHLTTPTQHVMVGITRSKVIHSLYRVSELWTFASRYGDPNWGHQLSPKLKTL